MGYLPTAFTGHPVGHSGLCSGRFHGERAPRSSRSLPCLPAPSPQERPGLGELYRARRTPAGHLHLKGTPSREQPTPSSRTNRVVVNLSPPCCHLKLPNSRCLLTVGSLSPIRRSQETTRAHWVKVRPWRLGGCGQCCVRPAYGHPIQMCNHVSILHISPLSSLRA